MQLSPRDKALAGLLQRSREWLNGCRGTNNEDAPDEVCECDDCQTCTELLEQIDDMLDGMGLL